jgi:hypothetical protein
VAKVAGPALSIPASTVRRDGARVAFVARMDGSTSVAARWRCSGMANFLLTFHGGSMPESKEEQDQVMQAWTGWFGTLGDALVDGGNPISQAKAITPDGSVMDATSAPSGYSIIKAESLDAAVGLAKGCPVLHGGANVLVSETSPVM